MNKEELLAQFSRLEKARRVRFFCQLSFDLTLIIRALYRGESALDIDKLTSANELQHRMCRFALDAIDGHVVRSDSETIEYVTTGFLEVGAANFLDNAFKNL